MANPLSPLSSAELNLKSPPAIPRNADLLSKTGLDSNLAFPAADEESEIFQDCLEDGPDDPPSSPFDTNPATRKSLSPHKIRSPNKDNSPVKLSPVKLSPVKLSPTRNPSLDNRLPACLADHPLRDNKGVVGALGLLEADSNGAHVDLDDSQNDATMADEPDGYAGMDDTAFSTFSAVPNLDMTTFARSTEGRERDPNSPAKQLQLEYRARYPEDEPTPRRGAQSRTPQTAGRRNHDQSPGSSPTPRRVRGSEGTDDTTNLLDFTDHFDVLSTTTTSSSYTSPSRRARASPTKPQNQAVVHDRAGSPLKDSFPASSPSGRRGVAHLLDFEVTPAPTPRSLPTITVRELESLKSGYLSQISSLKASLSGREAEVNSLKEAVGDAERRVGEAQEAVRGFRVTKEALEADRADWERRGKEMETVMRNVREEIISRGREKDELAEKMEESERKREEAETKAAEAESRAAGMKAGSDSHSDQTSSSNGEVGVAVEKVARELHALYKSKHETKVGALKRSYEARWEKRVKELERKVEEVNKENEELKVGRDATLSGVVPSMLNAAETEERRKEAVEMAQKAEEDKARIQGLMEEVSHIRRDNETLMGELEKERVEKGDLVAAVEEMLSMSAAANSNDGNTSSGLENLRGSISRASGLKAPGFSSSIGAGESRIGRTDTIGGPAQSKSRSGSGSAGAGSNIRSGMMSNIARMGRTRVE